MFFHQTPCMHAHVHPSCVWHVHTQVLFLPPMYFHQTLALSDAIAVNGWTGWAEAEAAEALFAVPRPRYRRDTAEIPDAGRGGEAAWGAALVCSLSRAAFGDAWALPARLWAERYRSLVADGRCNLPPSSVISRLLPPSPASPAFS